MSRCIGVAMDEKEQERHYINLHRRYSDLISTKDVAITKALQLYEIKQDIIIFSYFKSAMQEMNIIMNY